MKKICKYTLNDIEISEEKKINKNQYNNNIGNKKNFEEPFKKYEK